MMPKGNAVDAVRRFTSRLSCALLLTTYLTPAQVFLSTEVHADELHAVCFNPHYPETDLTPLGPTNFEGLQNAPVNSTAQIITNSGSLTGPGFVKVENLSGTPVYRIQGVRAVFYDTPTDFNNRVVTKVRDAIPSDLLTNAYPVDNLTTDPNVELQQNFPSVSPGDGGRANPSAGSIGLPILNTVEATNTEVQDLIRQRRQLALNSTTPSSTTSTANSYSENAPAPTASSPAISKKAASRTADYPSQENSTPQGIDLDFEDGPNWSSWAQAFADYERHSDLAPGSGENLVRKQTTVGGISGTDATYFRYSEYGHETLQMGLLGGGMHITNKFSDFGSTSDARQTLDGGFVGAYGSYRLNQFAVDGFFKTDMLQLRQRATVKGPATCPTGQVLIIDDTPDATEISKTQSGSVNQYTYTVGANAYYRFDLANGGYFEPVAGFLFSATTYGDGAVANGLGLDNGQFVRLQWGARVGRSWTDDQDRIWSLAFLGLMYDDVYVNGYTVDGFGFPTGASKVDEGKLRVLGQLEGNVDIGNGVSLVGAVNVRGGENLFGVGGRLGARMNW